MEQFKRALFAPQNSSFVNLKSEVKKVMIITRFFFKFIIQVNGMCISMAFERNIIYFIQHYLNVRTFDRTIQPRSQGKMRDPGNEIAVL